MKILFLDQYGDLGGAQACLLDLIPAIQAQDWTAHAAVPGGGPLAARLRATGVIVHTVRAGRSLAIAYNARSIRKVLYQTGCDIVYVNGGRLLPSAAIAAHRRVPLIFHAHWRYTGAAAWAARWSLRKSNASVIGCCRYVTARLGVPEARVHMIPNGVADCGFRERSFERSAGLFIGIIGRIASEKGQLEFLRVASLLAPHFPNVRFVICGAPLFSNLRYHDTVRRRARELGVEFLGWRDDIASVLGQLDLLVIASHEEGLPRVLLEAFSAGVPVVSFPAGGIPEALKDGDTGFLVPDFTAEGLAGRIRSLLEGDPAKLREAARNARRAWEQSYDVAHYRRAITNVLAALAQVSPAGIQPAGPPLHTPPPQPAAPANIPSGK